MKAEIREILSEYKATEGEIIASAMQSISNSRITECIVGKADIEFGMARVKLGLFLKKNLAMLFKAIVEDWDMVRIVREVY